VEDILMNEVQKLPYVRLTNLDRDSVVRRAIDGSFAEREAALAKVEGEIARTIYEAIIPVAPRKAAETLPDNWIKRLTTLALNVGGLSLDLVVSGDAVPVPYSNRDGSRRIGSTNDPAHVDAVNRLLADKEAFAADRRRARESLKALAYSIRSLRELAELWPEGEPYWKWLADRSGKPVAGLPAPQIAEINALLGLPKDDKK
jgi:hypothetical protein